MEPHVPLRQVPVLSVEPVHVVGHALAHVPQLFRSLVVSTHWPLQPVWPESQQMPPVQLPLRHWSLAVHDVVSVSWATHVLVAVLQ